VRFPQPGPYIWAVNLAVTLLSIGISMIVIFHLADRAVEAERAARLQAQRDQASQAQVARRATCQLVTAQDDAFTEAPPSTEAGIKAAEAWRDLSIQFGCS
jgi:hypothetical protein